MATHRVKSWLITGASSGFGRSLTEQALARGDQVAATARNLAALYDLKAKYGDQLWLGRLDVTDTQAVDQVVGKAFADLGRIDAVVSNAGYGLFGAAEEVSHAQIRRQIDTNLIGSIAFIRAALPHLRAQGGGRILQLSSMGGQVSFPSIALYHATKWGIEGFLEGVATEVAPFGIQITLVEPGGARTDFSGRSADIATPIEAYEEGPTGKLRRRLLSGKVSQTGDPEKMVAAMIEAADRETMPRRLALGSDAYTMIHAALSARLADLEAQKDIAISTDYSD